MNQLDSSDANPAKSIRPHISFNIRSGKAAISRPTARRPAALTTVCGPNVRSRRSVGSDGGASAPDPPASPKAGRGNERLAASPPTRPIGRPTCAPRGPARPGDNPRSPSAPRRRRSAPPAARTGLRWGHGPSAPGRISAVSCSSRWRITPISWARGDACAPPCTVLRAGERRHLDHIVVVARGRGGRAVEALHPLGMMPPCAEGRGDIVGDVRPRHRGCGGQPHQHAAREEATTLVTPAPSSTSATPSSRSSSDRQVMPVATGEATI